MFRDGADDRYRLTVRVRGLSRGFLDDAWVTRIAKPFIEELCEDIVWPVSIASGVRQHDDDARDDQARNADCFGSISPPDRVYRY